MKKASEKSAVRWSCAVLAVLFFFIASSAATLWSMQRAYGCAEDDAAGKEALVSGLYDDALGGLSKALRAYFQSGASIRIDVPEPFKPENTNLRVCARSADGQVILNTLQGASEEKCRETKTITVEISGATADRLLHTEYVTVDCALLMPNTDDDVFRRAFWIPFEVDDVFSRALHLVYIGETAKDFLWSAAIVFAALTLLFAALSLRGAIREAKRTKGAERMFNALPPDLYLGCVLPALVMLYSLLLNGIRDREILHSYLNTGSGEYRFLLRPLCLTGVFGLLLVLLMLLVYSLERGGFRYVFTLKRFVQTPFPRRILLYLVVMQAVKSLAIAVYLTKYTHWVILFLLLEKLVTLPVVYRTLRQLRTLMDQTAQFVQGDLSGTASHARDFATLRQHGADVDSIVRRISDSADEYVRSSRFKAELITNLSHDIKTPLTSIISYAQLLERDDLSEADRAKYVEVLQRHSARLQKLLEDLTEVSDAASGNLPVQRTVIDLCALVRQAVSGFEERLQKQEITVCFRMPEEPVFVTADPRLMQRVVDNLMNNICKYTLSGTEAQIAVVNGESSVAAIFRNRASRPLTLSGDALMERFVREDGARHTDGSGLGLSIAQSLMRLQGGKLWLHTEEDVFTAQILFRRS